MYNNLELFKGTDHRLTINRGVDGVWDTAVYLDEVSTGLYESSTIFILESVNYRGDNLLSKPVSESTSLTSLEFEWKIDKYESSDLFMYGAKVESGITKIDVKDTQKIDTLDYYTAVGVDPNGLKIVSSLDNEAIQINVALNSSDEGRHQRTLLVYSNDGVDKTLIGRIFFYGEVEGEDERLRVLLQNMGAVLDESDFILFKEHDITEMSPDFILLNQKRRELLLELSNIKPFIGTYKAILNAIDFFGYNNLTLKEYWLNVDSDSSSFGKLHAVPVANSSKWGEAVRKTINVEVPSSNLKKTSRFSLVYKLNAPNGEVDEWDIPLVDELFDFTPEEVLIKLYGLKNKLQKEYLPLSARIIDIVGEGDFFAQKNLNIWNNQNAIAFFSEGHDIKFEHYPTKGNLYIEDISLVLRKVYDPDNITSGDYQKFHDILNAYEHDFKNDFTTSQREDLIEAIELFYESYNDDSLETFNEGIPVGCPVILDGTPSFKQSWEDAKFTWNDADPTGIAPIPNGTVQNHSGITWDNWWKTWVYEIEWLVIGDGFTQQFRGPIDDYIKIPTFLPKVGDVSVEMRTYDMFGHRSYDRESSLFNVKLKEVEFYGFYKAIGDGEWSNRSVDSWENTGGIWELPRNNRKAIVDTDASWYIGLDRANYTHDNPAPGQENFSTVYRYDDIYSETGYSETAGPYFWDNCDFEWRYTSELNWESTRIGPDLAASFLIKDISNGSVLTVNYHNQQLNVIQSGSVTITSATPTGPNDILAWQDIADELNDSTDEIISKFVYNIVVQDTNSDGTADTVLYIAGVGKNYSKTNDFDSVSLVPGVVGGEVKQVTYNPTYDEVDIFSEWREVNRSTHITFCTEISKMPGIKLNKWTITNNTYPDKSDIYYDDNVLTYLFKYPGDYTISIEVEDTNGNKNATSKNILKVK